MSPNGHQGSLPAYKRGTEQDCTGLLCIFNKIGLACLCYLHCFHPSDMFGINTLKVQLLRRPAYVLMEFLLQLNEAVISLLCEGDVSQHCCHSVGSHCCCLQTAKKTKHFNRVCFGFPPKQFYHDHEIITHFLCNNEPLRRRAGRANASVARGLQPERRESLCHSNRNKLEPTM